MSELITAYPDKVRVINMAEEPPKADLAQRLARRGLLLEGRGDE